jgi:hypothetical protein
MASSTDYSTVSGHPKNLGKVQCTHGPRSGRMQQEAATSVKPRSVKKPLMTARIARDKHMLLASELQTHAICLVLKLETGVP